MPFGRLFFFLVPYLFNKVPFSFSETSLEDNSNSASNVLEFPGKKTEIDPGSTPFDNHKASKKSGTSLQLEDGLRFETSKDSCNSVKLSKASELRASTEDVEAETGAADNEREVTYPHKEEPSVKLEAVNTFKNGSNSETELSTLRAEVVAADREAVSADTDSASGGSTQSISTFADGQSNTQVNILFFQSWGRLIWSIRNTGTSIK